MKSLREGPFDLFGRTAERRLERGLRETYLAAILKLTQTLTAENLPGAVEIARTALDVRGFGHVKAPAARALLDRLRRQA